MVANQHYVPQSYLRRFATGGGQVYVFDKSQAKQFKSNIKNVASERYFYDLPADEADKDADLQRLEKIFQKVEDRFIIAVDEAFALVAEGRNMMPEHKTALFHFLHVQQMRTRRSRNHQKEMIDKMLTNLAEAQLKLKNFDLEELDAGVTLHEKAVMGI